MQLTDKVILIKEHLDSRGNVYPARKDPYLYGELPEKIRDNPAYVVPVAQVEVKIERIDSQGLVPENIITGQDPNTINLIPQYTKENFVVNKPLVEDKIVAPPVQVEVPSVPITTTAVPAEVVTQSTLGEDLARSTTNRSTRTRKTVEG